MPIMKIRKSVLMAAMCQLGIVIAMAWMTAGCSSIQDKRLFPYRPEIDQRNLAGWKPTVSGSVSTDLQSPQTTQTARLLRRGDRLSISLRDINRPEEISDVIDDTGCINLPLIGTQKIEDKSSSEVETLLENAYVDGGFYKKITVIVVPEEEEFFIRGEVNRQGRYPMSRDVTLLMAIALAGGYTDYANPSKIEILRGKEKITVNARRIEKQLDEDPIIKPGDIIVVPRGWT